jgi:hypothetical protein
MHVAFNCPNRAVFASHWTSAESMSKYQETHWLRISCGMVCFLSPAAQFDTAVWASWSNLTCRGTHLQLTSMRLSSDTVFLELSSTLIRVRESYHARVIQNWYTFCFTRLRGPSSLFKRPLWRNIPRTTSTYNPFRSSSTQWPCSKLKEPRPRSLEIPRATISLERVAPWSGEQLTAGWIQRLEHVNIMNGTPFHV